MRCLVMCGLVYMASRDIVDVDTYHKGIQYALEKLILVPRGRASLWGRECGKLAIGKSKFGFQKTTVSNFKSKRHEGSGNELVDYSRAPCLGADQKARGLCGRDWVRKSSVKCSACVVNRNSYLYSRERREWVCNSN